MKETITLTKNYPNWENRITILHLLSIILILIFMTTILLSWDSVFVIVIVPVLTILLTFKMNKYFKKIKDKVREKFYWRQKLLFFIHSNSLYKEDYEIYIDENNKERKRKYIANSAVFSYEETADKIIIYAIKKGDSYSDKITKLDVELSALLNLPLEEKIDRPAVCEYHYFLKRPERINLNSTVASLKGSDEIKISGNISYELHKVPHSLIVGGTGSGKSFFILGKIVSYLKLSPQADLRIIDPKKADLSLLRFVTGFDNKVATEANQICRILREAVELMEQRYTDYFNDVSAFGKTYRDFNLPIVIVIFDEFSAFMHSVDKKVAKEALDYVFTIVMKGRQAGVVIEILMQRPSADDLPTNIRAQMGFKAGLGAMDSIGYNMIFDTSNIEYMSVTEKGGGYIQIDGKHTTPVYFETPYIDKDYDFISEIEKLMKNQETNKLNLDHHFS